MCVHSVHCTHMCVHIRIYIYIYISVRNEPEPKHYELKLALFEPELKLTFKKNNGHEPN